MDGDPEQGRLDRPPVLEGPGQVVAAEVTQPRPEADVGGGGVLGLEAGDLLKGLGEGEAGALEEELAGQ